MGVLRVGSCSKQGDRVARKSWMHVLKDGMQMNLGELLWRSINETAEIVESGISVIQTLQKPILRDVVQNYANFVSNASRKMDFIF